MAETETAARKSGSRKNQAPPVGATINDQPLPGMEQVNSPERHPDIEAAAIEYNKAMLNRVSATSAESLTQKNLAGLMQHHDLKEYRGGGIYVHPKPEPANLKPPKFVVESDTGQAGETESTNGAAGSDPGEAPSNVSAD